MGMKASSGFFTGTKGYSVGDSIKKALIDENTSSVWKHIKPTADNYPGTVKIIQYRNCRRHDVDSRKCY